jgi:hypothetical protein
MPVSYRSHLQSRRPLSLPFGCCSRRRRPANCARKCFLQLAKGRVSTTQCCPAGSVNCGSVRRAQPALVKKTAIFLMMGPPAETRLVVPLRPPSHPAVGAIHLRPVTPGLRSHRIRKLSVYRRGHGVTEPPRNCPASSNGATEPRI